MRFVKQLPLLSEHNQTWITILYLNVVSVEQELRIVVILLLLLNPLHMSAIQRLQHKFQTRKHVVLMQIKLTNLNTRSMRMNLFLTTNCWSHWVLKRMVHGQVKRNHFLNVFYLEPKTLLWWTRLLELLVVADFVQILVTYMPQDSFLYQFMFKLL